jgi:heme A synthase
MDPAAPLPASDALPHILLALVAVIVVARLVGAVLRRFSRPPVLLTTFATTPLLDLVQRGVRVPAAGR